MLTEGVDEWTKPSVIIKSKLTDHQMKLEAASLASSSGLCQKGIYAEETQQKLFSSSEPKPRKDKSVTTAYTSPGGLALSSAPLPCGRARSRWLWEAERNVSKWS